MRDNARKIRDFFKKSVFNAFCLPHVYGRCQSRRERRWNAYCKPCSTPAACPVAGHNPVKRSCIFCIKIWPPSIPYSLFCWANPWRWFAFRHLCWIYQVIQPLGLFVPVLFGLHSSPRLISIFQWLCDALPDSYSKLPISILIIVANRQHAWLDEESSGLARMQYWFFSATSAKLSQEMAF